MKEKKLILSDVIERVKTFETKGNTIYIYIYIYIYIKVEYKNELLIFNTY